MRGACAEETAVEVDELVGEEALEVGVLLVGADDVGRSCEGKWGGDGGGCREFAVGRCHCVL